MGRAIRLGTVIMDELDKVVATGKVCLYYTSPAIVEAFALRYDLQLASRLGYLKVNKKNLK